MVKGKLKRIIIAAVSENGMIGNENQIPWKVKDEIEHFKRTTLNNPILFGRKTFESIGKPLNDRLNIVITKKPPQINNKANLIYFRCVKDAYNFLRKMQIEKVYICGGGKIYKNTIKHADEMIISRMHFKVDGNVKFPRVNLDLWQIQKRKKYDKFTVIHYSRIQKSI